MKTGIELIAEERQRQIEKEGWTAEHDAAYKNNELERAAQCYLMTEENREATNEDMENIIESGFWPWDVKYWKPTPDNRVRELVKAGAPAARDYRSPHAENSEKFQARKQHPRGVNLVEHLQRQQDGKPSQLNPLFVEEMMGFPLNWTALPFQDGEKNQSKPTVTPSHVVQTLSS